MEKQARNSSIELLRIVTIVLIIFGHFNVHGIWETMDRSLALGRQSFISCLTGWGGNMGNEIFMIITGYFMLTSKVHWKRVVLLCATMFLYSWSIAIFFGSVMDWNFTVKDIVKYAIPVWSGVNWFVCCYLIFMCFVPFINPFLKILSPKRYLALLFLNYFLFIFIPALNLHGNTYMQGPFIQFFIMYMLGGYIRLYGKNWTAEGYCKFWIKLFLLGILLIVIASAFPVIHGKFWGSYWRIIHLIEVPMALSCFMMTICHKPFSSKLINRIAGSVLGIYLIHDNPLVRKFIWTMWYPNLDYLDTWCFPMFMIGKVALIFLICLSIDQLRIRFIEPYMKSYMDARWGRWEQKLGIYKMRVCRYMEKF